MPVTVVSFTTPTGTLAPTVSGRNYQAPFSNSAQFTAVSGGTCAPGEYRQYIKGVYKANGSVVAHALCPPSIYVLPDTFLEDGCLPPTCTAYGHRSCQPHPYNSYSPNMATGCQYSMHDAPGWTNMVAGTTYALDVEFKGSLVDTQAGNKVLRENTWKVVGSVVATLAAGAEEASAIAFSGATDRILMAEYTRNEESGAPELHVVIIRPNARPPLDPASLRLTALDASGSALRPILGPVVHEISGRSGSTANVVCTYAHGSNAPTVVRLAIGGGLVTLRVRAR